MGNAQRAHVRASAWARCALPTLQLFHLEIFDAAPSWEIMKKNLLWAMFLSLATAGSLIQAQRPAERPVEPRAVAPRGPLLEAEKSMVALFEQAAPSVVI